SSSGPTIRSCSTKASRSRSSISASSLFDRRNDWRARHRLSGALSRLIRLAPLGKRPSPPISAPRPRPDRPAAARDSACGIFLCRRHTRGNLGRGLRFNLGLYRRPEPRGSHQSVLPLIGKALPMLKKSRCVALACLLLGVAIAPVDAAEREDVRKVI